MQPEEPRPRPYVRSDEGARILVVEDVPVTLEFVRFILAESRYRVSTATTVGEGLRALEEEPPDLVVLDLLLPDANGLELCRALRLLPAGEDIPVLIITGDDSPTSHSAAVRAGADDFLRKPILPAELQTRVRSLLRLRRLRQQLRLDVEAILDLQVRQEEMVQFVMHDLKNMLGALLISVELAEEDTRGTDWRKHQHRMATGARNLQETVSMFLDLSLADHANLALQPEEISARAWLHKAVAEFSNLGSRRRHPYEVTLEGLTTVNGDAHLLRRAIFNLLDNASRIAPEDSPIHVRAEAAPDGTRWRLMVCDQGPGVPEDLKERIFERFVRADAPASPRGGKGLGLAFCKLVAELHGGTIRVEDHQPMGSRFIFDLPLG